MAVTVPIYKINMMLTSLQSLIQTVHLMHKLLLGYAYESSA